MECDKKCIDNENGHCATTIYPDECCEVPEEMICGHCKHTVERQEIIDNDGDCPFCDRSFEPWLFGAG